MKKSNPLNTVQMVERESMYLPPGWSFWTLRALKQNERRVWKAKLGITGFYSSTPFPGVYPFLKSRYGWSRQKVDEIARLSAPFVLKGIKLCNEFRETHWDRGRRFCGIELNIHPRDIPKLKRQFAKLTKYISEERSRAHAK